MSLVTRIQTADALDWHRRDQLYELFHSCFDNTSRDRFERDLEDKHWVVLVLAEERVVGFTTAELVELEHRGRPLRFLYSGDTLVAPTHWHQPALPAAFGHLMLDLLERSEAPLYWFLISMGYRTYRLLPANFARFVPDHRRADDGELAELLELVARHKFGARFSAATGIVSAGLHSEYLKPALQVVPEGRQRNPHVRFFLDRNPGWRRGDELACLAPCTPANLTAVARRQLEQVRPEWDPA